MCIIQSDCRTIIIITMHNITYKNNILYKFNTIYSIKEFKIKKLYCNVIYIYKNVYKMHILIK